MAPTTSRRSRRASQATDPSLRGTGSSHKDSASLTDPDLHRQQLPVLRDVHPPVEWVTGIQDKPDALVDQQLSVVGVRPDIKVGLVGLLLNRCRGPIRDACEFISSCGL